MAEKSKINFQWSSEMVEQLIIIIKDYKTQMDYKNIDFNADVVALYSNVREQMASVFDQEFFGPIDVPDAPKEKMTKEKEKAFNAEVSMAKSQIKKGCNRIKEKIRAIRKAYNKAVINGTRSGSGKVVQEHYDQLAEIWKGSPATEKLRFGISSNSCESLGPETSSSGSLGNDSFNDEFNATLDTDHDEEEDEDNDNEQEQGSNLFIFVSIM